MDKQKIVGVVGLGYVGLPVATSFGKLYKTFGFDVKKQRIKELRSAFDRNDDVPSADLKSPNLYFTDNIEDLKKVNFFIVAVPTPVNDANQPDLTSLYKASETVGKALKKESIVVYESTVYPGATEEECVPVLERVSGLKCGKDFKIGYSPERINPGDKEHIFTKIKKVVSAQDEQTLEIIAKMYSSIVEPGVHLAPSIKVAEAAKVIENTQRDLNIALMNELAVLFDKMGIDTNDVLEAAGTKWNFLRFKPGLVGGHCIGVDPYYLTHKAEKIGYIPQIILAGRRINDGMGKFIAHKAIKEMIHSGHNISGATVTVLGITFKEDCKDIRNSKAVDIIFELQDYGINVQVCDSIATPKEVLKEYGIKLIPVEELKKASCIIVAVAHMAYRKIELDFLKRISIKNPVLIDVKCIYNRDVLKSAGFRYWRL
ncbi:GDP-mannose dehydrogenase [bacterium Unc6]|nr:GDP-mannose dehydrogenase [bacterium Unc6]